MRTYSTNYFFAVATLLATPGLSLGQVSLPVSPSDSIAMLQIVRDTALKIIRNNYFDTTTIDTSLTLQEIVSRLDPFSYYETKVLYEQYQRRLDDEELRFGIALRPVHGHVIIISVDYKSPADNMGIRPGDEILALCGKAVRGNDSLAFAMLAHRDSIKLKLYRASINGTWFLTVTKGLYRSMSVPVVTMIDSHIGYVLVTGFHRGTAAKLRNAVDYLRHKGMRALIIDLRGNRGGYVCEALSAANLFVHSEAQAITENSLVVSHIGHDSLNDVALYPHLPLAVLVNNSSCSAAEMFSGIMQDLDCAVIVGQPTIGKSLVLQFFDLPNKDKLYVAVAYYMLPSGRSVQRPYRSGKYIGSKDRDYGSYDNSGHTVDSDVSETECPTFKTASGRSVIPFAGIIPDYLVSQEEFYPDWLRCDIADAAALYLRVNSNWLMGATIDKVENHWEIPKKIVERILDSIRVHDTTTGKLLSARLAWMVPKLIKACVAKDIWGRYGYFMLWERNSATVRRAAALLGNPATIALLGK